MRERQTVRLLVVDERDRVLLFAVEDDSIAEPNERPAPGVFWITPGGGVEPGEDDRAAGRRELWEETGIERDDIGPCVWDQDHVLVWNGEPLRLRERYYLTRVSTGAVALDHVTDLERAVYRAHRWWTADEIAASDALIFPTALRTRLAPLLAGQTPTCPISLE